jgi:N-acetylglucosaminyl-diphospho-decaprenol L-rhamnosyltransferase
MSNPTNLRVGVVTVSYNTSALLRRSLQSVVDTANIAPLDLRIVVVDNASSDGSAAMVREAFPDVTLIANPDNRGFAAATNQGIEIIIGNIDYVMLLNPDAWLCGDALPTLVTFMEQHPRVGVASPRLLYPDGRPQEAAWHFPTLWMAWFDLFPPRGPLLGRLYASSLNGRYREDGGDTPFAIDHPLGAAMLIRAATLREVGLFDDGYWMYAEEVDWCYRCHQAGWAVWQVPAASVVHVGGAASSQFRGRSFVALHRARARYVRTWWTPRRQHAYRRIIRVGIAWATLRAWVGWLRGRVTAEDLRAQLVAYSVVTRDLR